MAEVAASDSAVDEKRRETKHDSNLRRSPNHPERLAVSLLQQSVSRSRFVLMTLSTSRKARAREPTGISRHTKGFCNSKLENGSIYDAHFADTIARFWRNQQSFSIGINGDNLKVQYIWMKNQCTSICSFNPTSYQTGMILII